MTRSWFEDLSALGMAPDPGPDGPGPLSRLPLTVGSWPTAAGPDESGPGRAARTVGAGGPAPTVQHPDAPRWLVDAFPLVWAQDRAPGFSLLGAALTAVPDDPDELDGVTDAPTARESGEQP